MQDAQDEGEAARSSAGRALAAARWGDTVVRRSAAIVLARAGELPDELREQLHQVTGEAAAGDGV
jgi:hypothetical protein